MLNLSDVIERGYDRLNADFPNVPRASGAGECALRLWARYHGKEDIPTDLDTKLTRFELGHEVGKMLARNLQAGAESVNVETEVECEYRGIQGHIDALLTYPDGTKHVVEFKSNYFVKPIEEKPFQALQAAIYAVAVGAPRFTVFVLGPAVQRLKGVPQPKWRQFDYETKDYKDAVDAEITRMSKANQASPPPPDPDAAWRCSYCQYSGCSRNQNVANPNRKEMEMV